MSSKPYDELRCQVLDSWSGSPWYAEIEDFDVWLAAVRRQLARRVDGLADELAGDDIPDEGYLAKTGRLTAARYQAGEIISREYGPLASEDGDDGDDDERAAAGQRPAVVDRDHPQWAEVDAEQQERIGSTGGGEGL